MRTVAVMHIAQAGGPAQHVKPWLASLRARGPVEIVAPGPGGVVSLYEDFDGACVLDYGVLTTVGGAREGLLQAARLLKDVQLFRRHFRSRNPDLVVVVTSVVPAALIAARLERIPRITYVAELFDKRFNRSRSRSLGAGALVRLVEKLSSAVICCSQTVADQFSGSRTARLLTVYPGIDHSFAGGDGAAFRRRHGLVEAEPLLAVIGNISRGRGQDLVIRALPQVRMRFPNARCTVVGEPHSRPVDVAYGAELMTLARELRLEGAVVFTGFTDRIADVYAAADIVINPARFNEPFGRVAIEALSAERPVIAARVGAVPEVLRDRHDALLVDPEDHSGIAAAVVELWEDSDLRRRLVEQGRLSVERRFRVDAAVAQFEAVVSELVGDR
jgi:glycosyltransferase involved in cell wall biosynthesis